MSVYSLGMSSLPNLARLRQARNMSRAQLGAALGFTERSVGRWENGESDPVLSDLRMIAEYFGVPVGYLIGETTEPRIVTIHREVSE